MFIAICSASPEHIAISEVIILDEEITRECPSWRGYFKSLSPEKQEELRKKYDFWKY